MTFLARLFALCAKPALRNTPRKPKRVFLEVEILEDRLAPATFNVTTTADSALFGSGSLRAAILEADLTGGSNTINVPAGTYDLTIQGTTHDGRTGALVINNNSSLSIVGTGTVIIDASQLNDRVFDIQFAVSTVTFNGLVIQNGQANSGSNGLGIGGGIYDPRGANLVLNNTFVQDNTAAGTGVSGGGIYQSGGNLSISGGAVNGNNITGSGVGAGINYASASGTVTLDQTRISNNGTNPSTGTKVAGGMFLKGGTLNMTNDLVTNNVATGHSGGMDARFTNVAIEGSTFANNKGGNSYGGLYLQTSANSTIEDTFITNNSASSVGAGLYWSVLGGNFNVANDIIIRRNTGPSGNPGGSGASLHVNASGANLYLSNSTISNNFTNQSGGGVYANVTSGASLHMINDTIASNFASFFGGGIYTAGAGSVFLYSDTFSSNVAGQGAGGVNGAAGNTYVQNTIISGNLLTPVSSFKQDVGGTFVDVGHNLVGNNSGSNFVAGTPNGNASLVGTATSYLNANLGPLQDNGSAPTNGDPITIRPFTMNLLPASPAIGAGATGLNTDERGFSRPGQGESTASIGAFEYQAPSLPGQTSTYYVENIYETLLTRTAESGGQGYWAGQLNSGVPASNVVQTILTRPEPTADEVNGLYEKYLRRQGEASGVQHWVTVLESGGTNEQVILGFLTSPEYIALNGGTNVTFVEALYQDVLGRLPDSGGLFAWVGGLDSGNVSQSQVAWGFLTSSEYHTDLVDSYYLQYLGRTAVGDSGANGFVNALNSGVTDQVVLAAILGSSEAVGKRT